MTYHHIWSDSILSPDSQCTEGKLLQCTVGKFVPRHHLYFHLAHLPAKIDFYYSACALSISYPGVASHKQMGARLQIYYRSGAIKKCNIPSSVHAGTKTTFLSKQQKISPLVSSSF